MPDDHKYFESHETTTLAARRKEEIRNLVPEAFDADGGFDADALKLAIGVDPERSEKRFGLVWPGKEQAAAMVNAPHRFHLYPDPDASVDFDNTNNAFVEADNLAALRLMQNAYQGQVKLIYIDPPYNTGNDFVYEDDFSDPLEAYLSQCEMDDDSGKRTKAKSTSEAGRKHSRWLNFIYPRLMLARQLLQRDGSIMISCDDNEVANLRQVMNEVFGEENFVASLTLLCNPKGRSHDKHFAQNHEYVLVYSKNPLKSGSFSVDKDADKLKLEYPEMDEHGFFRTLELRNTHREFGKHNRPNLHYPLFVADDGSVGLDSSHGEMVLPNWDDGFPGCWTWGKEKATKELHLLCAKRVKGMWKIYRKSYADGAQRMLKTILQDPRFTTEAGQREFNSLFESKEKIFDSPKSPHLIAALIEAGSDNGDIVMDFFGGSGSTGHAVWLQNARDKKSRRFVACTLPEPVAEKSAAARAGYKVISQITIDRLRLAGEKVRSDHPEWTGDTGFRVFRLAGSKKETRPATADDLFALLEASSRGFGSDDEIDSLIPHYICRFAMEAGFRLDAKLKRAGEDIWKISQEDRTGWIAIPRASGDLRERLSASGARQGDEVILVERSVNDSDVANCSAFFKLTTKRVSG